MIKIDYVTGDDWEGLYIDGNLVEENHTISIFDLLETLEDRKLLTFECTEVNQNYLEDLGNLPDNFEALDKNEFL